MWLHVIMPGKVGRYRFTIIEFDFIIYPDSLSSTLSNYAA